jgi:hypothetical protein
MPMDLPPSPAAYVQTAPAPPRPAGPPVASQAAPSPLAGVVGVCARWEADPLHVAEVVVVIPSGNATLDAAIIPTVKAANWPRPAGDTGGWTGRYVAIGAPIPPGPQPTCERLPVHTRP